MRRRRWRGRRIDCPAGWISAGRSISTSKARSLWPFPAKTATCWSIAPPSIPTEVQHLVARALKLADHSVVCETRRMGGAFGGKESQASLIAAVAALLAQRTKRPVKLRLDRDDDMVLTGKRHGFRIDYDVGFDADGRILGIEFMQAAQCGFSPDLSAAIADRAMFHADNCYYLPARPHRVASLQDPHGVQHRLPRFRRPAGHDGHRKCHRRDRAPFVARSADRAAAQFLRQGRPQRHAIPHGGGRQHHSGTGRRTRGTRGLRRTPRGGGMRSTRKITGSSAAWR